jgi:hypothetical protein
MRAILWLSTFWTKKKKKTPDDIFFQDDSNQKPLSTSSHKFLAFDQCHNQIHPHKSKSFITILTMQVA